MAAYVPPGWPSGVHPPGSEDFERTAQAWLLDVVPADYRLHGVLRRYPLALAAMAAHHTKACVAGAREGYRNARTEVGGALPPHALEALLAAYRAEGRRLVATAQAVDLVARALRGEVFTPQLQDAARPGGQRPAGERPPAQRRAAGPPLPEQPPAQRPLAGPPLPGPAAQRPAAERPSAQRPAAGHPAERPAADRAATAQPLPERPASGPLPAQRPARESTGKPRKAQAQRPARNGGASTRKAKRDQHAAVS
jgi:hypothetical protein